MNRIIVIVLVLISASLTRIDAQKIYSTKSGRISFFSSAPLQDIEAKTSEVESKLATNGQIVFTLLIKGFQFDNQKMEDDFNEDYMESSKYPKAYFKGNITNISDINFSKEGTYPATVKGELTIHGVTKEITANGTIEVKGAKVIATSKFNVAVRDYNIGGALIGKKIANTIAITVNCEYE
jgi:polyisoprenoid-binding protein YceI